VNGKLLPYTIENGEIQFTNGFKLVNDISGKLVIFGTGTDSSYFSNIYQIEMDQDFVSKARPQFKYCESTNTYSVSYIIGAKDWQACVEKEIKKV
jgi:hexokinase